MKTKLFRIAQVVLVTCLMTFIQVSYSQNGLDPDFGQGGTVVTNIADLEASISGVVQLSDGKIVAAGDGYNVDADAESAVVARYLVDGSLDTAFGTNGITTLRINSLDTYIEAVKIDASGRIYVVGEVETASNEFNAAVARLTANGALDTTFGNAGFIVTNFGTTLEGEGLSLAIQADGKIVLAGIVVDNTNPVFDELADFALARYNTGGSLDTTFGNAGYVITAFNANHFDALLSVLLQPDGKIVASGFSFTEDPDTFEESSDIVAARYNANGSLDTSFGGDGKVIIDIGDFDYIEGMALQSNGKILLCGDTFIESQDLDDSLVVRLNTDGSLDTSFSDDGFVITPFLNSADNFTSAHTVIANPDGSLLAVGGAFDNTTNDSYTTIAKYTASGNLDTSFRADGKFEYQDNDVESYEAIVTNTGKLLTAGSKFVDDGSNTTVNFYLAQFSLSNTLGTEDLNTNRITVYPNPVSSVLNLNFVTAENNTQIILYDTLGKVVARSTTDSKNETLDLGNLSNGIYYLQVSQNDKTYTEKIVKN